MSEKETEKTSDAPADGGHATAGEVVNEASVLKQNEDLAAKLQEYEELVKRQQAEFDNYRKRTLREKEEYLRYAGSDILKDLLGVIDNFDRAVSLKMDEAPSATSKALFDGV
ncbi:MAG: nucleotide exchange factor GrpE, partial [Spirochaetia bacterium]|nr:nucleotide exchange factor GrpE [Spirochaetia bacterium]